MSFVTRPLGPPLNTSIIALELQSRFARRVRQCLDAAVVLPPAAIEGDFVETRRLCLLGNRFADSFRGGDVAAVLELAADVLLHARRRCQRLAGVVVDDLGVNVLVGAEHAEPRALGRAENARTDAPLAPLQSDLLEFVFVCHVAPGARSFGPALNGRFLLCRTCAGERLAGLDLDLFAVVADALALIRLGLADLPHLGGELTDRLLVSAAHVNLVDAFEM